MNSDIQISWRRTVLFLSSSIFATLSLLGIFGTQLVQQARAEEQSSLNSEEKQAAISFITELSKGNFEKAATQVAPSVSKQMSAAVLESVWKQLNEGAGEFDTVEISTIVKKDKHDIIELKCKFAKADKYVDLPVNEVHKVIGFYIKEEDFPYSAPAYVQPEVFSERSITVGSGKFALPGTITIPKTKAPYPVLILVHGSGAHDRDESEGPNKPFRDLAWGLASQGIAVIRYDKRNLAHPKELQDEGKMTMENNVIDDAGFAVDLAASLPYIAKKKIFLLGHSLGAYLAPDIARLHPNLAGIVVMSGPARAQEDVMIDQAEYLSKVQGSPSAPELTKMKELSQKIKRKEFDAATPASDLLLFPGSIWVYFRDFDPVKVAGSLNLPMLILQGERDYQTTMEDFELWRKGLAGHLQVTSKTYPKLNHLYQEGTGKSTPVEYLKENHIPDYVINDISTWIKSAAETH